MNKWKVVLSQPDLGPEEVKNVLKVIRSRWLTLGSLSAEFEERFAKFTGVRYAVFVNSGTAALHLACVSLGLGPGDEVICPAFTFVATVNAILYTGARPVFADVTGRQDFNISAEEIEKKITSRTRAIMVMHYAGYPCRMDQINRIAHRHKLSIIEDAAHAIGAEFKGKSCGTWSDIGLFSFFPNKNMTTAEGGMAVTNNEGLARKMRLLRSHGMSKSTWDRYKGRANTYDILDLGYNYRPSEINAALGLAQLKKVAANNKKRMNLTLRYRKRLKGVDGCMVPFLNNTGKPSYHIFPLLLSASLDRNKLIDRLKRKGVQSSIHYPPVHQFSYYRRIMKEKAYLPYTEYIGKHEITLPLYPQMKEAQLDYVVDTLKQEIRHCYLSRKR